MATSGPVPGLLALWPMPQGNSWLSGWASWWWGSKAGEILLRCFWKSWAVWGEKAYRLRAQGVWRVTAGREERPCPQQAHLAWQGLPCLGEG